MQPMKILSHYQDAVMLLRAAPNRSYVIDLARRADEQLSRFVDTNKLIAERCYAISESAELGQIPDISMVPTMVDSVAARAALEEARAGLAVAITIVYGDEGISMLKARLRKAGFDSGEELIP
jgi:hypothetical protein